MSVIIRPLLYRSWLAPRYSTTMCLLKSLHLFSSCRSLLFFSMLLSLGLGSQIGILEGMIGPLFDIPSLKGVKKPVITGNNLSSADLRQCIAKYYHCRRIIAGIRTHVDCTTRFFFYVDTQDHDWTH